MSSLNKVQLIGNLGADPEIRYLPSGDAVCNIKIATSSKKKSGSEYVDETEWHRVVFFGKLAEISGQYLKKGGQVYVEGRIRTNKWQDKEGNDRYTTEIVANEMQMLGGKVDGGDREPPPAKRPQRTATPARKTSLEEDDDDLPFVSCDIRHDMNKGATRRRKL